MVIVWSFIVSMSVIFSTELNMFSHAEGKLLGFYTVTTQQMYLWS